jgi:hypothetical protein
MERELSDIQREVKKERIMKTSEELHVMERDREKHI